MARAPAATRARGWRRSRPGGSSTPAAARPPATAARRTHAEPRPAATEEGDDRRYQIEAASPPLHDDAASAEEPDWPQILAWYDDLVALTDDPVRQDLAAVLGRAVAVGHVLGPAAALLETDRLREVLGDHPGGMLSAATCTSSTVTCPRRSACGTRRRIG